MENTFSPKRAAPGSVRSDWPSAPPFGLHWAALTFGVRECVGIASVVLLRIRDSASSLCGRPCDHLVQLSKLGRSAFARDHCRSGQVKAKTEPPPARGRAQIAPPADSTTFSAIASPMPEPG